LHLQKIKDAFRENLLVLDSSQLSKQEMFTRIKVILEVHPRDRLTYRPPSIAILGQPACGKEAICD